MIPAHQKAMRCRQWDFRFLCFADILECSARMYERTKSLESQYLSCMLLTGRSGDCYVDGRHPP